MEMIGLDTVKLILSQPLDWGKFETIVHDILVNDDLPRLRKLGGVSDEGRDAVEYAYYQDETEVSTVVQVTSQKAQVDKFNATVKRLREAGHSPKKIVLVYHQPVASETRGKIQDKASELGLFVDVRDEAYLVVHLADPKTGVFARHFSNARSQLDCLLGQADPLEAATDRQLRAMLATLSAFVVLPRARLTRKTLLEKTVLAATASIGGPALEDQIFEVVQSLMPGEALPRGQFVAALAELKKARQLIEEAGKLFPANDVAASIAAVLSTTRETYDRLQKHVLARVTKLCRVDDASKGYLERNLRQTISFLLRIEGPTVAEDGLSIAQKDEPELLRRLGSNLPEEIARTALLGLHEFLRDANNVQGVSRLLRTYGALSIWNADPLGRRWQQEALARSEVAIDTDVVLWVLIDEAPESALFRSCLSSLKKQEVQIIVPDSVLAEVIGHLERAQKSFNRFPGLLRMPPEIVEGQVWHALVRGYYYGKMAGTILGDWGSYYQKYYRKERASEYIEFLLKKRLDYATESLESIPDEWQHDAEEIAKTIFEKKEQHRKKAQFRDEEHQRQRVLRDVQISLNMALVKSKKQWRSAQGYVISIDPAFRAMESHDLWGERPKVHIFTNQLPELCEFVCGETYDDTAFVKLLFDPVVTAAAELMRDEIDALTRAGVDLRTRSLDQIEWELRDELAAVLHSADVPSRGMEENEEAQMIRLFRIAEVASAKGYSVDPVMQKVVDNFEKIVEALAKEQKQRREADDAVTETKEWAYSTLRKVSTAAIGRTKKGKSRVRRALERVGLSLDELLSVGLEQVGAEPADEEGKGK